MANPYVNKVIINGQTKIDLTGDTVSADKVLTGITYHDRSGASGIGTCDYNANTNDATAAASEILFTKTAYVSGQKITGNMPNNGSVTGNILSKDQQYTVPQGYHDGSGKVSIGATEQAKITAGNIKAGVSILGVVGTYSGESTLTQSKSVYPSFAQQDILPDEGYDYLSQVTVHPITPVYTDNAAGGQTLTINNHA